MAFTFAGGQDSTDQYEVLYREIDRQMHKWVTQRLPIMEFRM